MGRVRYWLIIPIILIGLLTLTTQAFLYPIEQKVDYKYSRIDSKGAKSFDKNSQVLSARTNYQEAKPTQTPVTKKRVDSEKPIDINNVSSPGAVSTYTMLSALNAYRSSRGKSALSLDGSLQGYAQSRADYFSSTGNTDVHAGFNDLINNQDGFNKLGFMTLGENSSYGYEGMDSKYLIEVAYGGHPPHDQNQLDDRWTHVGIGVSGLATDLVFGGRKK